ncbi:acid phosphatase [Ideonella sp. B7]|uniref:acid phosphatase n=1 Tax=Ideonella benzenivorans TaxID=2831643 RepID=UPI001CED2E30|nr:acid phosphatase [Ideonella benzenivorans]MCA6218534.1 acid phosphatase [Ideonella benzenivorans]
MIRHNRPLRALAAPAVLLAVLGTSGCNSHSQDTTAALQDDIQNIVVIYAENRSFDSLFGNFPGAEGLSTVMDSHGKPTSAYVAQVDRDGSALSTLPPVWGGVTAGGITPAVTQAQSAGLANQPFSIETAFQTSANATLDLTTVTRDMYHRFFENQMQINGGKNDQFVAWADSGAMVMGQFDSSSSALYKLAQQYTLADNFFQGAFGGSFLNHQYLICACAPEYPNADTATAAPSIAVLDKDSSGNYTHNLSVAASSASSAMDGKPSFVLSGNITPANYFGDGKFYAINTMQPPYQPSGNAPADVSGNNALYANTAKSTTLPAQTATHIGDLLTAKGVSWKWYAGAWTSATADGTQAASATRSVIYAGNSYGVATSANVDFQPHHQPFNYYAEFDPVTHATERANHLQDYSNLVADAAAGTLPAVAFYKPEGLYNQHPGYANVKDADQKIADLVAKLQASPQWKHMVIVITYDENGGQWDHVAPPTADKLGPGTRIPAIIVSPYAKKGAVDHTQYDTASILRLITRRFGLTPLPGLTARDEALKAAGGKAMGDLTNALNL